MKIPKSRKIGLNCEVSRLMKTGDYKDVRIEMWNNYTIQSIYFLLNPPGNETAVNEAVYGNSELITIRVYDAAHIIVSSLFASALSLLYI
jgi:hypothetical protein